MTAEQYAELLPVIQAFTKGRAIQCRPRGCKIDAPWYDMSDENISFENQTYEFRVKPEQRRLWVNRYSSGTWGRACDTEKEAREHASHVSTEIAVEFVEVLKD